MFIRKIIFIILGFCLILSVSAQKGTIRGFVSDKKTGDPIMFCNVSIEGTNIGAQTDLNGIFTISQLPIAPADADPDEVGEEAYKLVVTYVGYKTLEKSVILSKKIVTIKIELEESAIQLNEVEISAERQAMKTDVKAASINISNEDLKLVPTIGGEPDLAQYLQIIPGVVLTGDQGGQLYIRGGSPVQNKVLMDGMTIYSPFHSIGLFSVFDADIIKNTTVYTGGFSAEYGGRISSIMDLKTKDGNKKRIQGKLSSNTFGSKLLLEGPFQKGKNTTFLFSGKTSYLDKTSAIYNLDLPYSYTDLYGKITLNANNGSKANIFGFNFQDNVNYQNISDLKWQSSGIGSEFVLIPPNSSVLIEGNFAFSKYDISLQEGSSAERQSEIKGGNMGFDFTHFPINGKIKYGLDVYMFSTDFSTYNISNSKITQTENTSEFSAYINYQFNIYIRNAKKFILEPGFRLQQYTLGTSPEPRLGIKYLASDLLRIKLAGGYYSQNILSTVSDRDVVNLFYGFISSPENLPVKEDGSEYINQLQKARHLILGIEYDINLKTDVQIEGYIKDFTQLTNINRSMMSNYDNEFIVEKGLSKGIDCLLKYKNKNLYIWAVYSLGFIERTDGEHKYFPHFDRRHNVNFVSSYSFGKNNSWKADARWNFGSGFPFTQTQGFYENITFSDGINTDYHLQNGELDVEYAELNKGRLPYYHRLDLSLSKKMKVFKTSTLEISASVTNAYDRNNIFYFNRIKHERVDQLPILPSAGISLLL